MGTALNVWGMQPALYLTFVVLISFAAFAVILDRSGYATVNKDGDDQSVIPYFLTVGAGYSLIIYIATTWAQFIIQ